MDEWVKSEKSYCTFCSNEILATDKYCIYCGKKLNLIDLLMNPLPVNGNKTVVKEKPEPISDASRETGSCIKVNCTKNANELKADANSLEPIHKIQRNGKSTPHHKCRNIFLCSVGILAVFVLIFYFYANKKVDEAASRWIDIPSQISIEKFSGYAIMCYPENMSLDVNAASVGIVSEANGVLQGTQNGQTLITVSTPNIPWLEKIVDVFGGIFGWTYEPISKTCTVTVYTAVEKVAVNYESINLSLNNNDSVTLKCVITPTDATVISTEYYTADNSIVSVSETGIVTAVGPGNTVVTITVKGTDNIITRSVKVSVANPITQMYFTSGGWNTTYNIGDHINLASVLVIKPENFYGETIEWMSSDSNVATVSSGGYVTVYGYGYATISAYASGGEVAYYQISVIKKNDLHMGTGPNINEYSTGWGFCDNCAGTGTTDCRITDCYIGGNWYCPNCGARCDDILYNQ